MPKPTFGWLKPRKSIPEGIECNRAERKQVVADTHGFMRLGKRTVLEDIPKWEFRHLRKGILKAKGNVILLVHPFFVKNPFMVKGCNYKNVLARTLEKSASPVVILEEAVRIGELEKNLLSLGIKKRFFVLPTEGGDSRIESTKYDSREIYLLAKIMKEAGAKKIFIGGALSSLGETGSIDKEQAEGTRWTPVEAIEAFNVKEHERSWMPKNTNHGRTVLSGCVGGVYNELVNSQKFEGVRLMPELLWPDKPEYHTNRRKS